MNPSHPSNRTRTPRTPRVGASPLEWTIVCAGLVSAIAGGVIAYRTVGLYGDGPFAAGYHRIHDPATGRSLLVHESRTAGGTVQRVIDGRRLVEVRVNPNSDGRLNSRAVVAGNGISRLDIDSDGDGRTDSWEYYDAAGRPVKAGFSRAGDGVLDAWAFMDGSGQLLKIEVSTRRDGTVDRWEHYQNGELSRVDEDRNRDGRVDRRLTYKAGMLADTVEDVGWEAATP